MRSRGHGPNTLLVEAYKAAPDEDLITYIKDKKSQVDDGRASYNAEELMTMVENKYEARLLDEDNAWGTLLMNKNKFWP